MIAPRSSSEVPGASEEICAQDLRAAAANPPDAVLTITEAEEFFSDGVDAREALDIDVPAVGMTPAAELPSLIRGAEYQPGHMPETLREFVAAAGDDDLLVRVSAEAAADLRRFAVEDAKQNKLFSELLFAARDLAEAQIVDPYYISRLAGNDWIGCRECGQLVYLNSRQHVPTCKTGRVMGVVLQLMKAADSGENENGEEGGRGQSPEPSCAEGESSPRVDFGEPWVIEPSSESRASVCNCFGNEVYDPIGATDVMEEEAREYAKRVMLCVNFCAGIPDGQLEKTIATHAANGGAR